MEIYASSRYGWHGNQSNHINDHLSKILNMNTRQNSREYMYKYVIDHDIYELIKDRFVYEIITRLISHLITPKILIIRRVCVFAYIRIVPTEWWLSISPDRSPECPAFTFSNNNNNKKRRRAVLIRGFVRLTWLTRRAEEERGEEKGGCRCHFGCLSYQWTEGLRFVASTGGWG